MRAAVFAPLQALCACVLTLALLRCLRLARVPHAAFAALALLAGGVAAAFLGFLRYFRPANCFLMSGYDVAQQPAAYDGLARGLAEQAVGFIHRCGGHRGWRSRVTEWAPRGRGWRRSRVSCDGGVGMVTVTLHATRGGGGRGRSRVW